MVFIFIYTCIFCICILYIYYYLCFSNIRNMLFEHPEHVVPSVRRLAQRWQCCLRQCAARRWRAMRGAVLQVFDQYVLGVRTTCSRCSDNLLYTEVGGGGRLLKITIQNYKKCKQSKITKLELCSL